MLLTLQKDTSGYRRARNGLSTHAHWSPVDGGVGGDGGALTLAESTQKGAFQPARPWWGSDTWRHTHTHTRIFINERRWVLQQNKYVFISKRTRVAVYIPATQTECSKEQTFPLLILHSGWHSPTGEGRCTLLLARRVHVDHGKVLRDLLHVLVVEEGVETRLVYKEAAEKQNLRCSWLGLGLITVCFKSADVTQVHTITPTWECYHGNV